MSTAIRRIGGHVSAAGGVDKAIERAAGIGANCAQVFSGSPRVWQRPGLASIDADKVSAKCRELHVSPIITHALYLVNFASENPELVAKSHKAVSFDLAFDAKLHGGGVVVHLGSHQGRGWEAVREQVAAEITKVLEATPDTSHFLMENAAGQQGKVGGELTEIRWLLDAVKSPRLGWCFDTCHAFASGYFLGEKPPTEDGAKNHRGTAAWAEIERLNLWSTLRCVHVNDSRDPFGSGRDRHANLSTGVIPRADLRHFLLLKPLVHANPPLILEVPGFEDEGPDAKNVALLKELVGE